MTTVAAHIIHVDSEFAALIPPPPEAERLALEASIARDGIRDPLVLWGATLVAPTFTSKAYGVVFVSLAGARRSAAYAWLRCMKQPDCPPVPTAEHVSGNPPATRPI